MDVASNFCLLYAVLHTECVVLYNEVVQCYRNRELTVHCNSAQRSCAVVGYFPHTECVVLLALCAGGNLVESRGFFHLSSKHVPRD